MRKEDYAVYMQYRQNTILNSKKRTLKFINSGLGQHSAEMIAYRIMRKNDNFAHFNLANNNLMDIGVLHLSNGLYNSNHVVSLNLSMNKITHKGAEYLAEALKYSQSLIELNLSSGAVAGTNRNRISEKGAAVIANALEHNRYIQFLNISGNCIGNAGALRLFNSITKVNSVVVLKLNSNDLTQHAAQSINKFL